jgi:hypothetical protein
MAALTGVVVWRSLAQVAFECEVVMEFRGSTARATAASGTREDSIRSAVNTACASLASGMTDSMACDRTPPVRVDCRER